MNIQAIKAFVLTAETGSISEAARKMARSRPQVSNWISDLEVDWEVRLFDRSHHKPQLTDEGRQLLIYSHTILRNVDNLEIKVKTLHQQNSRLRIGFERCISPAQIQSLAEALLIRYPSVSLSLFTNTSSMILRELQGDSIDIGFCNSYYVKSQDIRMRPALDSRYIGCCAPDHPLNSYDVLTANDLSPHRQIDLHLLEGDLPDTTYFSADLLQVDSYQTQLSLVSAGHGWCICPLSFARSYLDARKLVILNHPEAVGSLPLFAMYRDTFAGRPFADWVIEEGGRYLAQVG